jgi:hypothetical protein
VITPAIFTRAGTSPLPPLPPLPLLLLLPLLLPLLPLLLPLLLLLLLLPLLLLPLSLPLLLPLLSLPLLLLPLLLLLLLLQLSPASNIQSADTTKACATAAAFTSSKAYLPAESRSKHTWMKRMRTARPSPQRRRSTWRRAGCTSASGTPAACRGLEY